MGRWCCGSAGASCATRAMRRTRSRRPSWSWSRRPAHSGAAPTWADGCTWSPTASRSRPMPPRPGGECRRGRRARWLPRPHRTIPSSRMSSSPALHEEIARLPEKIRLAVILCDLQGITQAQAAESLGLSERHLATPAGRRPCAAQGSGWAAGVWHADGAVMAAVRLRESRAVVPPAWSEATLRAALDTSIRRSPSGSSRPRRNPWHERCSSRCSCTS